MGKSSIDILQENLKERGLSPKTHASGADFIAPRAMVRSRFVIAEAGEGYFYASDTYGKDKTGFSSTHTGIYLPVDLPAGMECEIFKKEKLDRFFVSGKKKTGITYIDKSLTIKSKGWVPKTELTPEMVDAFLDIFRKVRPVKLIIEYEYFPDLIPFKGKSLIGLRTNRWISGKQELEVLLGEGMKLLLELKKRLHAK